MQWQKTAINKPRHGFQRQKSGKQDLRSKELACQVILQTRSWRTPYGMVYTAQYICKVKKFK